MSDLSQKQSEMLTAPVTRIVCRLAVPSIIIMLISSAYNLADTFFVGGLGKSATAAIGVVAALMAVIQAIGFFFGHGSGNYMSRKLGAGEIHEAEVMAASGFFMSVILGAVIGIFGLIFINPLVRLLGASETMLPHARAYARYILIAMPFMTGSLTLNNQLRYLASASSAMWGMVSGALLNCALDPLFIYVFHMGTGGAGLATMLGELFGFGILFFMTTRPGNISIRFRNLRVNAHTLLEMLRGGAPSFLRQSLNGFATIVFNRAGKPFGDAAVAAISIVQRVNMFALSAIMGFGQGFQPVCGFNYGAKRYDRVIKAFYFCCKLIAGALTVLGVVGIIFAPQIIAVFQSQDPAVIEIGAYMLRLCCAAMPLMGPAMLINMMLQTTGAGIRASILAVARSGLFLIPAILILTANFGLRGLEWSQFAADMLTATLTFPMGAALIKSMRRGVHEELPGEL
jgi:putative MATE family efflux protein